MRKEQRANRCSRGKLTEEVLTGVAHLCGSGVALRGPGSSTGNVGINVKIKMSKLSMRKKISLNCSCASKSSRQTKETAVAIRHCSLVTIWITDLVGVVARPTLQHH